MGVLKHLREIIIHAHFYQPDRADPWSKTLHEKTANIFYTSYNDLIIDECYGPLSLKKFKYHDEFVSVYSRLSFNFGPTLINFIENNYPKLYSAIIEADILSSKIYSSPSAIAQVYNHAILPLISTTKKKIYIAWGIENFEKHFKRKPLGMWLSETACDDDTLECLIEKGIKFTILSPEQALKIKNIKTGEEKLISNYNNLDTSIPYIWKSKKQKGEIKIFFYNKIISDKMCEELINPEKYFLRMKLSFDERKNNQHLLIASDGENYGHHIKNGNEYLIKLIELIEKDKKIKLNNLNSIFENQSDWEVEIKSPSSWSCPHGVKRWSDKCECRVDPKNTYQKWKKTLRDTLNTIEKKVDEKFLYETAGFFQKPFELLEKYIAAYDDNNIHSIISFIEKNSIKTPTPQEIKKLAKILACEIEIALANTSCGWFFDDILNIETIYSIKRMIRAMQLAEIKPDPYLDEIKKEKSNYKLDVSKNIEELKKLLKSDEIAAAEISLFDYLDFINPFYKNAYHPKIIKKENDTYTVKTTHLKTLEENIHTLKISKEKNNFIIRIKKQSLDDDIILIDDLTYEGSRIVKIITSEKENDKPLKNFFYFISRSTFSKPDILKMEHDLKEIIHTHNNTFIPYLRDIILAIIKINPETDLIEILEKKGVKLIWKKGILGYDNEKTNA